MKTLLGHLGIFALASLFLLGGLNKILNWSDTLERMEAAGLTPAALLLPLTVALELIGGAALVYGRGPSVAAGLLLAGFTVLTNLAFHRFWEMNGVLGDLELSLFFKNIAIAGALTLVAARKWDDLHQNRQVASSD